MAQLILAIHTGIHDAAAAVFEDYSLRAAVSLERLTRHKNDGRDPEACIDEVLGIVGAARRDVDAIAWSRCEFPTRYYKTIRGVRWLREQYRKRVENNTRRYMLAELRRYHTPFADDVFDVARFKSESGFRDDAVAYFYNHHEAHALAALFYTAWNEALLVTADAGGDSVHYSHRHFAGGTLTTSYGGDECLLLPQPIDSLGWAYAHATAALGFIPFRHEGKLTGLAAFGKPTLYEPIAARFSVNAAGRVQSDFGDYREMSAFIADLFRNARREDAAASIQAVLEETMLLSIKRLLAQHPSRNLGLAGGVFANVKLNRRLAEELPVDEVFIFPAMGDEGLPAGGALCHLLQRDGLPRWLAQRHRLRDVYLGRDYTDAINAMLEQLPGVRRTAEPPAEGAARRLEAGEIGAIYTGRMEYGPRALGARSILANPSRRDTHDLLNQRLSRSEFMPFAPVIIAEKAAQVFDVNAVNAYACRFMTMTCNVRAEWRERIAAVVHVDGSARPQIIERDANPLYYDILVAFERLSGLPVLVNTSFNVHEEPIVNTPAECRQALTDGRIDFVVTTRGVYERVKA
ncbi:MAG TPA: carbamoyltransferase C-terminal domain-containing protein [Xanthobacteraceae bacterium]|jgi:carbamoyltransferase